MDETRQMLIKAEDTTDSNYGCIPTERSVEDLLNRGILNIDKPPNPTSHEIVAWVKRILGVKKAGHAGTLELEWLLQQGYPRVTGVLPVALMKATKIVQTLLPAGKEYVGAMRLHMDVPEEQLRQTASEFVGKVYQRPPVRSSVVRRLRIREIYYLEILEIKDRYILFKVGCQAGFYVRMLCHHLGWALGCGAHMRELRRTQAGPFREDETLITLYDLKDAYTLWKENANDTLIRKCVLPLEYALNHVPKIIVRDSAIDSICHGADLAAPGVLQLETLKKGDTVAIFSLKGEAVALGKAHLDASEILEAETGIVVKTQKVLMEIGTYPPHLRNK